jgi:hypothetical protein
MKTTNYSQRPIAMLRQVRWAVLFLSVGCVLGFYGGCYYLYSPTVPATIATIIGVPMALVGLALKGAELAPAPFTSDPEADAVRSQATPTQLQIIQDVTRYQYGSSVHLEPALEKIGLADEETDEHPGLLSLREAAIDGAYALVLEFRRLDIPAEVWQEKEAKMTTFFGPKVKVNVQPVGKKRMEVAIVATKD